MVSERVVHTLEAVEIDEHQAQQALAPVRLVHGMAQAIFEHDAVGKPSEGIPVSQELDPRFRFLACCDVFVGPEHADYSAAHAI